MRVRETLLQPARRAAVLIAILLVATFLTRQLHPYIQFTGFIFFYGAVVAAALYAGPPGGLLAIAVGIVVVERQLGPRREALQISEPEGYVAVVAFAAVSLLVTALAESMRGARRTAELRAEQLEHQTGELERQRRDAEVLAEELEDSNVELETTAADARRARDSALAGEERLRLVDEASRILTSSLDYETTVAAAARLAVPRFADWCGVDLVVDGHIKRLAVAHVDPERARWAREVVDAKLSPDPESPMGVPGVIRRGKPLLVPVVTDAMLAEAAEDQEALSLMRAVGVESVMIVPIQARDRTLGALTLVASKPGRHFGDADLAIAQDLARRAGMAIDNARLYRAALAANEAKANFLATMSHELRTPLTAIIGYEELLSEGIGGPLQDGQRHQLQRIKASADQLLSLIDQILLYTRVEAGQESARVERVEARAVLEDAVGSVLPAAEKRRLPVRIDTADPALVLRTDPAKLRQILINLLTNAVKFTSAGEIVARASARDDLVIFEVQDTGIGISAGDLDHIFEPFWQVQQTTTRETGGSGLGLTVAQRLATILSGRLDVESTPGVGTTFRLILPKELAPAPANATGARTP